MTRPRPAPAALPLLAALLAASAACGSDAPPPTSAALDPCGSGAYWAVAVLDAVRGGEQIVANGYPVHVTHGGGASISPGARVARPLTAALVSGRNAVAVAVTPAVVAPGRPSRDAAPEAGPARFRAWVCGPDGAVVAGDPAGTAASDSAFAAFEAELRARWPRWAAAEDSALAADPALADSLAALVASDRVSRAVGVGPALDAARAWAAARPVAVEVSFVRPGGPAPSDGQPSFDAVLRDAPVVGGAAADSAALRAYAVRLRALMAARDTAAVWSEFAPALLREYEAAGGPAGLGIDSSAYVVASRSTVVMADPEPFAEGDVQLRSWAGGRVWELYRDGSPGLLHDPDRGAFRPVYVGRGPDGSFRVVWATL